MPSAIEWMSSATESMAVPSAAMPMPRHEVRGPIRKNGMIPHCASSVAAAPAISTRPVGPAPAAGSARSPSRSRIRKPTIPITAAWACPPSSPAIAGTHPPVGPGDLVRHGARRAFYLGVFIVLIRHSGRAGAQIGIGAERRGHHIAPASKGGRIVGQPEPERGQHDHGNQRKGHEQPTRPRPGIISNRGREPVPSPKLEEISDSA